MPSRFPVDAAMERVKQHGGVIARQPREVFWSGYGGYFQNPDGYHREAAYASSWKFDANGMLIIEDTNTEKTP